MTPVKRFAVFLPALILVPAARAADADYAPLKGPLAVETVETVVLKDRKRDKELPVAVCFPKEGGPYPVIVFSHGAGGSGRGVLPLPQFWASHGYVCLMPTHADSLSLLPKKEKPGADDLRDVVRRALTDSKNWLERPRDVSFLLDSFAALEEKVPGLKGKMDARRIGVGGHSLGAYTAQLIGGATIDVGEERGKSLADPRVKAVLLLSGQGSGQMGLTEKSWDKMTLPALSVTGSLDRGAKDQPPEWRREPFQRAPGGDKYFLFLEGAHHGSFTGRFAANGGQKAIFGCVQAATLAFWDGYLKGEDRGKKWFRSDAAEKTSKGAKLERK